MLVDFGVVGRDKTAATPPVPRHVLAATLRSFIGSLAALRATAVVVVDDAQRQQPAILAELSALVNASDAAPALLVVLAGEPALVTMIDAAISSRVELGPLARDDVAGYIEHRLSVAGPGHRVRFDDAALDRIYEVSRGVPGTINLVCDRALAVGFSRAAAGIDGAIVAAATPDTHVPAPTPAPARAAISRLAVVAVLVAFTLAGAGAAFYLFRDDVARALELWQNVPAAPAGPVQRQPAPLRAIPPPDVPGV